MVAQNWTIYSNFWESYIRFFRCTLSILHKSWLTFCWFQQKIQKMSHFRHFNDHTFGSKHDNYIKDPIFSIYTLSSISWYISFLHFKIIKIQIYGVLLPPPPLSPLPFLCIMLWSVKVLLLHPKYDTFKTVKIDIFFLQKIC